MTNLRILVKRDGTQVVQEYVHYAITGEQMGQAGTRWQDIPIVEEPEPTLSNKFCYHVYESDCHGIEMLKDPNGKEWAIGGTARKERWLYDPWCGKILPPVKPEPEKSLAQVLYEAYQSVFFGKRKWKDESPQVKTGSFEQAQAAEQYLLSKGWRKPE